MKSRRLIFAAAGLLAVPVAVNAVAQPAASPPEPSTLNVEALFASVCGFCHADGGRAAGKGPQLMDTKRSDEFLRNRIKDGKEGAMPAFGQMFSDADIDAIIKYIHNLKPEGHG
jgi:mono/diheme cytochrome c family protein